MPRLVRPGVMTCKVTSKPCTKAIRISETSEDGVHETVQVCEDFFACLSQYNQTKIGLALRKDDDASPRSR